MSRQVVVETLKVLSEPDRGWLYDYQTLVTGILAVLAAMAAWWISRGQLRDARNDRERRMRAARAVLPTVLSAICEHAELVARALKSKVPPEGKLYPVDVGSWNPFPVEGDIPTFPANLIAPLERMVELTSAEGVAEQIEAILREAQVLDARTRGYRREGRVTYLNLGSRIVDAAVLYARAESLFGYARRQADDVDSTDLWPRVSAALSILGVHEPWILEIAEEDRASGLLPGEAYTLPVT